MSEKKSHHRIIDGGKNAVIKIKGSNTELFGDLEEGKPIEKMQSGKYEK